MWKVVDSWINRYFADEEAVLLIIMMALALLVIVTMGQVLAPFLAAVVLAFLLQGVVNLLKRWRVPHLLAVALVFSAFISLFLLVVVFLFPIVIEQMSRLLKEVPGMIVHWQEAVLLLPERYPHLISEARLGEFIAYVQQESAQFAEAALGVSMGIFPGLVMVLIYLVLVPLLVFFMLKDRDELMQSTASLLPERRPVMKQVWGEMTIQIANYVRGKAIEVILVGASTYIWFVLLGVNYAALLALMVGLSVVIPYVGAAVVTVPVVLVGLFQWGWGGDFFWLFFAYSVIQFIDGNVLVPLLFSEAVNLHPILIILAVLVFGGLWGLWGVFFAIPLATLVKALYNAWPRNEVPELLSE
ncbi:MAG: AI-2E family transporter [Cellvibrionales bacterium]|nr:MAG: AI-2E family transporter [Cellvibrionales bacterium]